MSSTQRVSQTFAARTYAELAVITADIPSGLAPLRPAPARASAPAAARDRAIMATAILTGLAWVAAFVVSPDAGPGPSVAGALAALLFVGGTGSAFVSLFLLGIRMRSQRTQHPGSQLPPRRRRVDSGTSAAHKAISATSAEQLPAPPGRGGAQPTQPSVTPASAVVQLNILIAGASFLYDKRLPGTWPTNRWRPANNSFRHVVMSACRFGCDELFERGYISVG